MENKPVQILMDEFKQKVAADINSSGLPIYIITPILKGLLNECMALEQSEYVRVKNEYEKQEQETVDKPKEES